MSVYLDAPNQHFSPGPVPFPQETLEAHLEHQKQLIHRLLAEATADKKEFDLMVPWGGNTDATGTAKIMVFESPQGFGFTVHRFTANAINPATGNPYTPATPYTTGSISLYMGDIGVNSLVDFAPPAAGGNVFPQLSVDGEDQAAIYRGERMFVVVTGGPVSVQIGGRIRAKLFRLGAKTRD